MPGEVESSGTLLDKINSLGIVASRITENVKQDQLADIYIPLLDRADGDAFSTSAEGEFSTFQSIHTFSHKPDHRIHQPKGTQHSQLFYTKLSKMIPPTLTKDLVQEDYEFSIRGIFPEIHHAWITFDHQLILWNYLGKCI
jgi:hypothetical protein